MIQFFKDVNEAKISYTNKTRLKPTHILISPKTLEEIFYYQSKMRSPFFHNIITDEMKILDLIVVVVDIKVLGGDADKFLLVADETSERIEMTHKLLSRGGNVL